MTPEQQALQQALDAAKLATAIGSQLKAVDQLSYRDSSSIPANRININEFINCVKNPNARVVNKFQNVPHGFAPPPPEEEIQNIVPDAPSLFKQNIQQIPVEQQFQTQQKVQQTPTSQLILDPISKNSQQIDNSLQNDITEIKKSVEQINKNLIRLVDVIRNKK